MTPAQLIAARKALGLSARALAKSLGYGGKRAGKHAGNDILRMEYGQRNIPDRVEHGITPLLQAKLDEIRALLTERHSATHSRIMTLTGPATPPFDKCDRDGCYEVATHFGHMGLQYCDAHH